jgi:hypothetical protein
MTVDGVWIGNWIQVTITASLVYTPYEDHCTAAHTKSSVFTSRFLVTDLNTALYLRS